CARFEALHRFAYVRAYRFGGDEQLLTDLLVLEALGEEPEHIALTLRQSGEFRGRLAACERAREDGIDIRSAACDGLDGTNQLTQRRLLEHKPACTRIDSFDQQRLIAGASVEDHAGRRGTSRRTSCDFYPR